MSQLPTRERILQEALTLFSEKGYGSVSVAQIAEAVGIKAPSLYKHYKSKQDIFDAILEEMAVRYEQQAKSMQMNGTNAKKDKELFSNITENQLIEIGKSLFIYFLHDEFMCKFRRFMTIEQYHNKELSDLYTKQFMDDPIAYQEMMFALLMQEGILSQGDPKMMAMQFYSPIFFLLSLCDCQPDRESEALEMIEQHIKDFNRIYRIV